MASRSLNKVILIGNLTRDPELRYTPAGTAVCTFGLATNRSWTTQTGETKEETEFHRIVAWNKLAELCSQLLAKGRKVYVEGRLSTHTWAAQDGTQRTTTETVIEDMIILDSKRFMKEGEAVPAAMPLVPVKEEIITVAPSAKEEAVSDQSKDSSSGAKPADAGKKTKKTTKKTEEESGEKNKEQEEKKEEPVSENITPDDIPF